MGKLRIVRDQILQDLDAAGDDGEEIVEVVRNAAGELADGIHLLRMAQLLLGRDLLGDVADHHEMRACVAPFAIGNPHLADLRSVIERNFDLRDLL